MTTRKGKANKQEPKKNPLEKNSEVSRINRKKYTSRYGQGQEATRNRGRKEKVLSQSLGD